MNFFVFVGFVYRFVRRRVQRTRARVKSTILRKNKCCLEMIMKKLSKFQWYVSVYNLVEIGITQMIL